MPGKIKVKILAGRNLPVMDRSGDTTDAYVEIKFGNTTYKTDVCRKTLNPQWNSEWYRFEVDDAELQDEPLQIRLMDHDTYSANDAIGKVYLNLNPLLLPGLPLTVKNIWTLEATMNSSTGSQGGSAMTGWIPVFDTMHGIRGEVNVIVKVELFSDFNKFRQSSCGVQFFYSPNVPHGYHAQVIHGFVEELIVSDDPEYKWIDKLRTPRASNEARQTLFFKISGEVQRKIGLKALDLGGNAVIGYVQNFDLEGESGIVARGIGTAVTLVKVQDNNTLPIESSNVEDLACFGLQSKNQLDCSESDDSLPLLSQSPSSHSPIPRSPVKLHTTCVGNKFPKYERVSKHPRPAMRVSEYKASTMRARQMSLQHSPMANMRKGGSSGSSLSLSDDLICESSLRSLLALEDMRGERTSAFSRGLKNLKHLPKRVIQIKSKISDSFDDESDQDSTYSSTWSVVGSESTRSSIVDVRQSIKRKKFTHKKIASESGIAALLIRSVHTGFPLDSVSEDRETPTPSPVNSFVNRDELPERSIRPLRCANDFSFDKVAEEQNLNENIAKNNPFLDQTEQRYNYNDNKCIIPMISSSETDTSTSEDDEEPSESSTNYNILDDSFSVIESSLPGDPKLSEGGTLNSVDSNKSLNLLQQRNVEVSEKEISPAREDNQAIDISFDVDEIDSSLSRIIIDESRQDSMPEGLILDYDMMPDEIFKPLISSAPSTPEDELISPEYSILSAISTSPLRTSPSFKLKILGRQENFDSNEDPFPFVAMSTPLDEDGPSLHEFASTPILPAPESFILVEPYMEPLIAPLIDLTSEFEGFESVLPPKSEENKVEIVSVLRKDTKHSALLTDLIQEKPMDKLKKENETEMDPEQNVAITPDLSSPTGSPLPYKKYLFHTASLESQSSIEKKEKTSKKVSRTDTVIYKGPSKDKEKPCVPIDHKDITGKIIKATHIPTVTSPTIIVAPPSEPDCHLRVPMADTKDIKVHSPYPQDNSKPLHFDITSCQEYFLEPQLLSDRFVHKYRQHCMLDLIKTIDAKMMVHNDRKDSAKRKRRDRVNLNSTPSPDSIRRSRLHRKNSRSKSPDKHHHHHHHHSSHHSHQASPLAIHSVTHSSNPPGKPSPPMTPVKESPLSCAPSTENLSKSNAALCLNDPLPSCSKEKLIPSTIQDNNDESKVHETAATQLAVNIKDSGSSEIVSIPMDVVKTPSTNLGALLIPGELDPSVHKSHSEGSLGKLKNHLTKITNIANMTDDPCVPCPPLSSRQQEDQPTSPVHPAPGLPASVGAKVTNSPAAKTPLHRRSSDSDLSITPKGNSLAGSDRSMGHVRPSTAIVRTMNQDALEMLEYPFITIQQYPPGFVLNLGGLVSARSVKLIERISNLEEPEGRDAWWKEIRMEVRSHARALGCNVVLGYKEEISICDDVCVLNASGTAAVINLLNTNQDQDVLLNKSQQSAMTSSIETDKIQQKSLGSKNEKTDDVSVTGQQNHALTGKIKPISESNDHEMTHIPFQIACNLCHLPYNESSVPFKVDVSKCAICRRAKVPDVLFTTIELPENIPTTGRGVFLQATVCKCKRDLRGELNAKEISDCLPFLEYELHSLLLNKLKIKGMNAIFGLKVQVSIGERLIIGMAVGTAVFLTALPTPSIPKIASGNSWHNEDQLAEIQKALIETVKKNRELYRLKPALDMENGRSINTSDTDESDDDLPDLDLGLGTKDACVLEVDDVEDMDRINLLMDESTPEDFHVVNTQSIPGLEDLEIVRNLQMFTQISRAKIPAGQFASMPAKYFARMLQTVFFKLRRMVPCALCDMQFKVALPEPDEIQLSVVGMALGLGEPTKINKYKRKVLSGSAIKDLLKKPDENDLIFNLDEDQTENAIASEAANQPHTFIPNSSPSASHTQRPRPRSPFRTKSHAQHGPKHVPLKERYGVDITPLSYLPGGRIERYIGNLNFFFIRESTSIRESGGLSGFTHSFITEILAIVRAHITALGGNAMVAFFMTQCVLLHSPHKNQGQCLINVGGDVVTVSYFGDERHNQNC